MLQAINLHKSFSMGRSPLRVLKGASLEVARGEFVAVTGASGCGKSTLLHLLGALDVPDCGAVRFNGLSLFELGEAARRRYRTHDVGFVFQLYHLLPECNVLENVLLPSMVAHSYWGWRRVRRKIRSNAEQVLERVGLSDRLKQRPATLSGGERQRVAIARALCNEPALLLADEPTGNLDERIGKQILTLLTELNEAGQTIVMVTHDAKVASHAHRFVRLSDGAIQEAGTTSGTPAPARYATKEVVP